MIKNIFSHLGKFATQKVKDTFKIPDKEVSEEDKVSRSDLEFSELENKLEEVLKNPPGENLTSDIQKILSEYEHAFFNAGFVQGTTQNTRQIPHIIPLSKVTSIKENISSKLTGLKEKLELRLRNLRAEFVKSKIVAGENESMYRSLLKELKPLSRFFAWVLVIVGFFLVLADTIFTFLTLEKVLNPSTSIVGWELTSMKIITALGIGLTAFFFKVYYQKYIKRSKGLQFFPPSPRGKFWVHSTLLFSWIIGLLFMAVARTSPPTSTYSWFPLIAITFFTLLLPMVGSILIVEGQFQLETLKRLKMFNPNGTHPNLNDWKLAHQKTSSELEQTTESYFQVAQTLSWVSKDNFVKYYTALFVERHNMGVQRGLLFPIELRETETDILELAERNMKTQMIKHNLINHGK